MDDLFDGCLDGCGDGCLDGCFNFDGCLAWLPWSGRNARAAEVNTSSAPGYMPGYAVGSAASEAAEAAVDENGADRRSTGHAHHGEPGHMCKKPELTRTRLRFRVRIGHEHIVDELVEFGKSELKMAQVGRWLTLRLRPNWRTHVVVAFGTSVKGKRLKIRLHEIAETNPGLVRI